MGKMTVCLHTPKPPGKPGRFDILSASPSSRHFGVSPAGFRQHPQCIVNRLGTRKDLRHIAIQDRHIGALGEPRQVLAANTAGEVIMRSHRVGISFFHNSLVLGGSHAVHYPQLCNILVLVFVYNALLHDEVNLL